MTSAVTGSSAVSARWVEDPNVAMKGIAVGLRKLHELPVEDCPYDWSIDQRIVDDGIQPGAIGTPPPIDKLVVCHGDPCVPNTILDDNGQFSAHVDLSRVGVADRWADLAVASMSLEWNYIDYDESIFWKSYGIAPDPVRIEFYRRLWNAAVDQ